MHDFLQRCLESPFSRKLDLWNFLDIPRSRLVKYPLLLREILRHTPPDHPDVPCLEKAVCREHPLYPALLTDVITHTVITRVITLHGPAIHANRIIHLLKNNFLKN